MTATANAQNGKLNYDNVEAALTGEPQTLGYKPTLPVDTMWGPDGNPFLFFRRDIEFMDTHPMIRNALNYFTSGIAGAEFWGGKDTDNPDDEKGLPICEASPVISDFVQAQCERFWDRGVPQLQLPAYKYGWAGAESNYCVEDGIMKWDSLVNFAPRDTFILTQGHVPIGVRVKNVIDRGNVDLWMASDDVPAKGLWYAHQPEYSRWYGQSQLLGAWRPWRRLAWKDGAETVLDGGIYRLAYAGPIVGYPEEDLQGPAGSPNTTLDSQGRPRRFARDIARQIAEQFKAGAAVGFPTTQYPKDSGGGPKWKIELPTNTLNCGPILEYVKYLHDCISYGIGVPPELLQAAETGSGYSGRQIPMEAFLDGQQKIADAFLHLFVEQVLKPLVLWNWGPVKWEVKVKRLLETKSKARQKQGGEQPGADGMPGQPPPPVAPPQPPPAKPPQPGAAFSLVTDRIRDLARRAIRRVAA